MNVLASVRDGQIGPVLLADESDGLPAFWSR